MTKVKESVKVVANKEIGIEEAAKLIDVPQDQIVRAIGIDELFSKSVNRQVRLLRSDVLAYKKYMNVRRRGLAFLVRQAQELKLDYQ